MGNLLNTIKKFAGNKNTITLLGVIVGILVLWGFYTYRVNNAITPIRVPYALEEIPATGEITQDKIGFVDVNSKLLNTADIIQNEAELVGQYVNVGTSIPKGSLFYRSKVIPHSELPNAFYIDIPDGFTVFVLSVNNHTTYGNTIYPGDKIDLYMRANDEDGKLMYGMFIESITVLAVRDSSGNDVFGTSTPKVPAELVFSVENEMYELLYKANSLGGVTLVPVPRNKKYTSEGGEVKTHNFLKEFILNQTADIPEEV